MDQKSINELQKKLIDRAYEIKYGSLIPFIIGLIIGCILLFKIFR